MTKRNKEYKITRNGDDICREPISDFIEVRESRGKVTEKPVLLKVGPTF